MSFHPVSNYLVCGASSGIGLALLLNLLEQNPKARVFGTYRDTSNKEDLEKASEKNPGRVVLLPLNAEEENDYGSLVAAVEAQTPHLDGIINAIGLLHHKSLQPERKIDELDYEDHLQIYKVNTLPTLMLAKHLKNLIKESPSPYMVSVSAKVGSISDNKMGGWHSYRISKAALNMAIKNISIEFKRLNKKSLIVAIHPGTTETKLSEPFMAGARKKYKIHTADETAKNILNVIAGLSEKETGGFFSWDGTSLPW